MQKFSIVFLASVLMLGATILRPLEAVPELNAKIKDYLDKVMNTKVDRGECWDLAAAALAYSGAYFDRTSQKTIYQFGKVVDPKRETIFPGDIVQFEKVELSYETEDAVYTETMGHHTAIIYEVKAPGVFVLAHQNTSFSGKKVATSGLNLADIKKGKMVFYRPVASKP
ncbi:MAG: hypothetical protein ACFCUU_15670 [Cyclobacteriaceae bacterium]